MKSPYLTALIVLGVLGGVITASAASPAKTTASAPAARSPEELEKALAALKENFPPPPTLAKGLQDNPQLRDFLGKYQRNVALFKAITLPQNCRNLKADLDKDIVAQKAILGSSNPKSKSTGEQYNVAKANLEWLEKKVAPWLESAIALTAPPPAKK